MIGCLIVEDELPARNRLLELINNRSELQVVGMATNGREAIQLIDSLKPELLFLDVHLPDISGLDVLKVVHHKPHIVFTTAYDRYAVQAFEHNALDYLLKPYSADRFRLSVEKILNQRNDPHLIKPASTIIDLPEQNGASRPWTYLKRIPAKTADKIYLLNTENIVYFISRQKVVTVHLSNDFHIVNYTLDELQMRLDPELFFRIHRSTIANLNFVQTIEPLFGGTYLMHMKDKHHTELNVSRNAGRNIRQRLGW